MTKSTGRLFGYFGHHKCASTWLEAVFGDIAYDLGLRYRIVYKPSEFDADLGRHIAHNKIRFIAYGNADFAQVAHLENLAGIHVVRDPRDIIVSAYFSHLTTHSDRTWPELVEHRRTLQRCDKETGLFHEIAFRKQQFEEMRSWSDYHGDNVMQLRMEDLTSRTYQSLLSVTRFLGLLSEEQYGFSRRIEFLLARTLRNMEFRTGVHLPSILRTLPAERILGIVWSNEFEKKSGGRKPGEEDRTSHYRKGVPGDWRNHLNRDHLAMIEELYGDVIRQYGYEGSRDVRAGPQ
jgi:hypothetical protein